MANYLEIIKNLNKIPGIGKKTAERITFYLLENQANQTNQLLEKIKQFINNTFKCKICGLISKNNPCNICSSAKRNQSIICIVKSIQDALTIERSKSYNGLYHVLGNNLLPDLADQNGAKEKNLNLARLLKRISVDKKEILFALENNQHGRFTIQLIKEKILQKNFNIKFSNLAVGIPVGTALEYIDKDTLKSSIMNRTFTK